MGKSTPNRESETKAAEAEAKAKEEAEAKAKAEAIAKEQEEIKLAEQAAEAEAKAKADAAPKDAEIARAAKSGLVVNRVRGPAPMMTEEGVKAAGETFRCSASRAKSYGTLIDADVKEEPEPSEESE